MTITIFNESGSSKSLASIGTINSINIGEPAARKKMIEIPGRDGYIDASVALTGYPIYDNRAISIGLTINEGTEALSESKLNELMSFAHGKDIRIEFDFNSGYYFKGRCNISCDRVHPKLYNVTLSADCDPYALKATLTTKTIATGSLSVSSVMPTKMTVNATTQVSITRGGSTTTYTVGAHRIDYPLLIGSETLTINTGTGTITYREGKL